MVKEIARGDENIFEQLVKKYEQGVFNTIYRYIGNHDDVEDVAQEVFIRVWRYAKSFKGKAKFSTWLYRIVVNQCLDYRDKHRNTPISLEVLTEKDTIPESLKYEHNFEYKRKTEIIKKAIAELPERQRMALVLSEQEDKSYKEIAQIMQVSLSSVESLIFRARDNLKKKLAPLRENGSGVARKF